MMNLNELTGQVEKWAMERGLDEAQPEKQMLKLFEEIGELAQGLAKGNMVQVEDSIGDAFVVLTILSMQLDMTIEDCVAIAYGDIKDRKGKMVNGVFVKESDLK